MTFEPFDPNTNFYNNQFFLNFFIILENLINQSGTIKTDFLKYL